VEYQCGGGRHLQAKDGRGRTTTSISASLDRREGKTNRSRLSWSAIPITSLSLSVQALGLTAPARLGDTPKVPFKFLSFSIEAQPSRFRSGDDFGQRPSPPPPGKSDEQKTVTK
jgi:hypothetical protein